MTCYASNNLTKISDKQVMSRCNEDRNFCKKLICITHTASRLSWSTSNFFLYVIIEKFKKLQGSLTLVRKNPKGTYITPSMLRPAQNDSDSGL